MINIGDKIEILKEPDLLESFEVEVVGLLRYKDFESLFNDLIFRLLQILKFQKKNYLMIWKNIILRKNKKSMVF